MTCYLDTSAAVKLVVAESQSKALNAWLRADPRDVASSDLLRTELMRATRRGAPESLRRARELLESITLIAPSTATYEHAAELEPDLLRSLDALHLAAAVELGDELEGIITYDDRLAVGAQRLGIAVIAPH